MNLEAELKKETTSDADAEIVSGAKIDSMLLHFDLHMRERLVPEIAGGEESDEAIPAAIWRCFDEEPYRVFQGETLGVYGGAFGLSHNSRKNFVLFQNAEKQPDDIKGVRLPYLPRSTEAYQELIDGLFLGRRGKQPLMGGEQNIYSPEFYWQLAQIYHKKYHRFEPSEFTQYLHDQRSPYVYCPIGEMAFFLYAWRLLFRHFQRTGSLTDSISENLSFSREEKARCANIWRLDVWQKHSGIRPELDWLRTLDDLGKSEEPSKFRDNLVRQWADVHQRLDVGVDGSADISQYWKLDWFSLGLLKKGANHFNGGKPTDMLFSLLEFARSLNKGHNWVFEDLGSLRDSIQEKSVVDWKDLERLDSALQACALAFLRKGMNGIRSISALLSELHSLARFPLLPYFYWTAIDGLPKEHFVFPIWESWRFPVEVRVPERDGRSSTFTIPAVGIALIAISPMQEMRITGFDPADVKQTKFVEAHRRLFRTERVFVRIARPLIDAAFYGVLIRDSAHMEGRAEQVESWAHALQTKLALLQVFYDRLSAQLSANETVAVKQEFWTNMGDALRSIRRTINALSYYNRVREFLSRLNESFITLRLDPVKAKYKPSNRGLGNLFLDAFHLMAAKVRLADQKYGDLRTRLPNFKVACDRNVLPPLTTQYNTEYAATYAQLREFLPSDGSVQFKLSLPENTSLDNFEVWEEIELRAADPIRFYYDTVVGVVIDEMISNACKHVNEVEGGARIVLDLSVEMADNAPSDLGWATLKIINTAAFERSRVDIPEGRSLLELKRGKGLGLFFNHELSRTLTGDATNFSVRVLSDLRHVESTFRFPVTYSPTLT